MDRGQTTQDYLFGVTILLLTVTFVFGYVPNVFDAYEADVDGIDNAQADRAAEYLLENYSVEGRSNMLRFDGNPTNEGTPDDVERGINEMLANESARNGFLAFRQEAGLNTRTERRTEPHVNVIIVNTTVLNRTGSLRPHTDPSLGPDLPDRFEYGDVPDSDQTVASETRVITLDNDTRYCRPTCWLVVRVW